MANRMTNKQVAFLGAYLGVARMNATKAATIAGYGSPRQAGAELLSNPVIREEIQLWRDQVRSSAIADIEYRVSVLDDVERRYHDLMAARADEHAAVSGGETGLLVRQVKLSPSGITVAEYQADTAITKEIRELHKQAAQEMGQWTDRHHHAGSMTFADLAAIAESDPESSQDDPGESG